jgi:hypothetical protein
MLRPPRRRRSGSCRSGRCIWGGMEQQLVLSLQSSTKSMPPPSPPPSLGSSWAGSAASLSPCRAAKSGTLPSMPRSQKPRTTCAEGAAAPSEEDSFSSNSQSKWLRSKHLFSLLPFFFSLFSVARGARAPSVAGSGATASRSISCCCCCYCCSCCRARP